MANSVRPMVHGNSNLATPRNGLSRAPALTIMLHLAVPQNRFALCGFYFVLEDSKAVQVYASMFALY